MQLSIVIPLLNEAESLIELNDRIHKACSGISSFEVIFIDDGSTDNSWDILTNLANEFNAIRLIQFRKNYGKTQALNAAFKHISGEVVVTLDADLQDFPEQIPILYNLVKEKDFDLVSGWKQERKDPAFTKNIPSKLFNWVAQQTSGLKLHDFNCGLKAYKGTVAKEIELKSDMHRYIPVLVKQLGYQKITEIPVPHAARKHGVSKFGSSRFVNGFLDLITLWFISKFGQRPMHFFGAIGTIMFIIGFITTCIIGMQKLYLLHQGIPARLVTENALFYISLCSMLLGTQLFLAGFLGEIFIRNSSKKQEYVINKTVGLGNVL